MHTKRLLDKIENKLQDSFYAREEILSDLNDLLSYVAATYPLPTLQTTANIVASAGSDSVVLPDDFHCNIFRVENITTTRVCKVVFNFKVLAGMHDGLTVSGHIVDVAAENGVLHFRKSPEEDETLKIFYNKKTTTLTDSETSFPDCIPGHLHDPILSSYILYDKFSEIEDGTEGDRNNTTFYWNRFINGMQSLQTFYPNISLQNIYQRFTRGGVLRHENTTTSTDNKKV